MTLLVAGISGSTIWMISDTAISGGGLALRQRTYQIKIIAQRPPCEDPSPLCIPQNCDAVKAGWRGKPRVWRRVADDANTAHQGKDLFCFQ